MSFVRPARRRSQRCLADGVRSVQSKSPDPRKAAAAYAGQWREIHRWLDAVDDSAWNRPSVIEGWRVADLVAHLGLIAESVVWAASRASTQPPLSVGEYLARYASAGADIDGATRQRSATSRRTVLDAVDEAGERAGAAIANFAESAPAVVAAGRGPIRWADFLITRCVELVVHADDLSRSTERDVPFDRKCLQVAVRALTQVLSSRAPGRSVEFRVPPFAAVQCVEGPRHTRGTPGAVVELTPTTFLRLAAGRTGWASALESGEIKASGIRADMSPWLPLLS